MLKFAIRNMVITVEFSDRIDLGTLLKGIKGIEYEPEQFPGMVYRMENPRSSFLIFSTGKMNCTGTTNMKEANIAINKLLNMFKDIGIKVHKPRLEIQNIVASCESEKQINLAKVLKLDGTEYDPESFPGLVYRAGEGVVFLIFGKGKIVCVGARSKRQVRRSINDLVEKLTKAGAFL